uniref:Uncharacterized protein n=1 Tax=Anguilla anguilla TaxID=7936 RepID=A0A0E9SQT9_ANGAN
MFFVTIALLSDTWGTPPLARMLPHSRIIANDALSNITAHRQPAHSYTSPQTETCVYNEV